MMNICIKYLRQGGLFKLNFDAKEYFCGIFANEYFWRIFLVIIKVYNFKFSTRNVSMEYLCVSTYRSDTLLTHG